MTLTLKKKLVSGVLAFSLMTTSLGGSFAASVYAAAPESVAAESETAGIQNKDILIGLAAVGVIAALANRGHDDKGSASANNSGSNSANNGSGSTGTGNSGSGSGAALSAQEQQALTLLNNDRAKYGLSALKANNKLNQLAEDYAEDMIARGFFSHNNPEGQTPFDRMRAAGVSYRTAGENLAINSNVTAAETAFMNSSGHRANILNSAFTEVGIGVVQNSSGQVYVVQEFIGN
jgi:uncharacterized protein YkwD